MFRLFMSKSRCDRTVTWNSDYSVYACGYISYNSVRWLNSQNNKTVIPLVAHI